MSKLLKRVVALSLSLTLILSLSVSNTSIKAEGIESELTEMTVTTEEATLDTSEEVIESSEEITTEATTEVVTEVSTEEVITTEKTEQEVELSTPEKFIAGETLYTSLERLDKRVLLKKIFNDVKYLAWFRELNDTQIKEYFGADRSTFKEDLIDLLLKSFPEDYLLNLSEADVFLIFGLTWEEFNSYFNKEVNLLNSGLNLILDENLEGGFEDIGPMVDTEIGESCTFVIDGQSYTARVVNKEIPAMATIPYGDYSKTMICSMHSGASPFMWDASYIAAHNWTSSFGPACMRDEFWRIAHGKDPNSAMLSLSSSERSTLSENLTTKRESGSSTTTAPTASGFVLNPSTTVSYDSETGLNKTGIWTVNTGTEYINARITWSEGLTFHYLSGSTWVTKTSPNTDYLGYTGSLRQFYFTTPADANITATITITSEEASTSGTTKSVGYYVNDVILLTCTDPWWVGSSNPVQIMALPRRTSVSKSNSITFTPQNGELQLKKTSSNTTVTNGNNKYTLGGAIYSVKDSGGTVVGQFETDVDGIGHVISNSTETKTYSYNKANSGGYIATNAGNTKMSLPIGSYTVVETTAPKVVGTSSACYALDKTNHNVTITGESVSTVTSSEVPYVGSISLTKKSMYPDITDGNSMYNLTGAQYTIYKVSSSTATSGTKVGVIEIKNNSGTGKVIENIYNANDVSSGASKMSDLPFGYYIAKETKTSNDGSYLKSDKVYRIEINESNYSTTQKFEEAEGRGYVEDSIQNDPVTIVIEKQDSETTTGQGSGSLVGAVFRICYYDGEYTESNIPSVGSADRVWYIETKLLAGKYRCELASNYISKKYSSSELFTIQGIDIIPKGTITIEEYEAPTGYTKENATLAFSKGDTPTSLDGRIVLQIKDNNGTVGKVVASNQVEVGSEYWVNEQVIRADATFTKIDYKTNKPMADIPFKITSVTTGESHIIYTNSQGVANTASSAILHSENTNGNDAIANYDLGEVTGVWYGDGSVKDDMGALPYDDYILDELPCTANKGKQLETGIPFSVTEHKGTVSLGNITNVPDVYVTTKAKDAKTNSNSSIPEDGVTIVDTATCSFLTAGSDYLLRGYLVDQLTGEKVLGKDGNPITADKNFKAPTSSVVSAHDIIMDVDNTFVFDATGCDGKSYVVYEELYIILNNVPQLVAEHKDINDEGQTINFIGLGTTALDNVTETHLAEANGHVSITDKVAYKNLVVGDEYEVEGKFVFAKNGEDVLDPEGNVVTSRAKFTPTTKDGIAEVVFEFDASELAGETIVAFETLYKDGEVYLVHADLNDEDQTIRFPKVKTTALDSKTGQHFAEATEEVTIKDTFSYENLIIGKEYTLKGVAMDGTIGEPILIDGKQVTAEVTFIPTVSSGSAEVVFVFDATTLKGKSIVIFEDLYMEGVYITCHADINDRGQTVYFPEIKTTARDSITGLGIAKVCEKTTIIDKVEYSNLYKDQEYLLKGKLYLVSTGLPLVIDGEEVTAEKLFTPTRSYGYEELEFTFDSSALEGDSVVVFEELYKGGVKVATHADIEDKGQTVKFPSLVTFASMGGKEKTLPYGKDVTVVDRTTYINVTPGLEYVLKGTLIDKSTGEKLVTNGTAYTEVTFTAVDISGSIDSSFSFNTSGMENKELVVYQELYEVESGELIASHADINNADQTVKVGKKPDTPKTGDTYNLVMWLFILMATGMSLVIMVSKKLHKSKKRIK